MIRLDWEAIRRADEEIERTFLNRNQEWYRANRQHCLNYAAAYYREHKEQVIARTQKWRAANAERYREYRKLYMRDWRRRQGSGAAGG
jgi:hypothetical protein